MDEEPIIEPGVAEPHLEIDQHDARNIQITDPAAQREFDLSMMYGALKQARQELAAAKLAYHLTQAGNAGMAKHPNQLKSEVLAKQKIIDSILVLIQSSEVDGMPMPSVLDIAAAVPPPGGGKMKIKGDGTAEIVG